LFNYTRKIYKVLAKEQFSDDIWKYKLNGYSTRWFPSPFLLKVDTRGMVALGSNIQKGTINFNTTFDREAQLQALHHNNQTQADISQEQLDAQVLQIDKDKQKEALATASDLPMVRRSKRNKIKTKIKLMVGQKFKHDNRTYTIFKLYKNKVAARSGKLEYDFNRPHVAKHLITI
jgi:hypothetical protein